MNLRLFLVKWTGTWVWRGDYSGYDDDSKDDDDDNDSDDNDSKDDDDENGNDCVFSLSLPRDKQCFQQTRPHGEQGQYH